MTDASTRSRTAGNAAAAQVETTLGWLESQFPGWAFDVDQTATYLGELRPLWIATRGGHHAQAELTAAKLHTRLSEYLDRQERREALMN